MKEYTYQNCKKEFYATCVADILKAIDGGSFVGALTLCLLSIDYAGMGIDSKEMVNNKSQCFKRFIEDYLSQIDLEYKERLKELKYMRNVLSHTYGSTEDVMNYEKVGLEYIFRSSRNNPNKNGVTLKRMVESSSYLLEIHIPNFIGDYICAVNIFFENMEQDLEKNGSNLKLWYDQRIRNHEDIDYSLVSFKSIHDILEPLDYSSLNIHDLRDILTSRITKASMNALSKEPKDR
jgi:hypothetical protein